MDQHQRIVSSRSRVDRSGIGPKRIGRGHINARRVALGIELSLGALAVAGGINLIRDGYGMPTSWLERGPFTDYTIPGVVLLAGIGGGMLAAALASMVRPRFAPEAALAGGLAVLGFLSVEAAVTGYHGPRQVVLNVVVGVPALGLVSIGRGLRRSQRS